MMSFYCEKCGQYADEESILRAYNGDEDMIVNCGSTNLCPECWDEEAAQWTWSLDYHGYVDERW